MGMRTRFLSLAALLGVALYGAPVYGQVYVDVNSSPGGDGTSWAQALDTIQAGVDLASATSTPQVWVADGTYPEVATNGGVSLIMRVNVGIYGGFAGPGDTQFSDRDPALNVTIIRGTAVSQGTNVSVAPVVWGESVATLDGFTIQGGRADNGGGDV